MDDRAVYETEKDQQGDVIALRGGFGRVSAQNAIAQIQRNLYRYHVPLDNGSRARIEVVRTVRGKYLRTNWDGSDANNLDDLPAI